MHLLECPLRLWMESVRPELVPPSSAIDRQAMENGEQVDVLAQRLFPGGVKIEGFNRVGFANTQKAIAKGAKILYQPSAVADGLTARADILVRGQGKTWDLHEVKATTSVKREHPVDVAFQKMCFERAGIPIGNTFLVRLNNRYVRDGEIDVAGLLKEEDVTQDAARFEDRIPEFIEQAREVMSWGKQLTPAQLRTCSNPRKCAFLAAYLEAVGAGKRAEIFESDPSFDSEAIAQALGELVYPLHFLDYETFGGAIPPFNGFRPYEQIPFQFAVYVLDEPGGTPRTFDFLADTFADPSVELVDALREAIGPDGSVIAWNAIFEKSCNEGLAKRVPAHAKFLRSINKRMFDLMLIFKRKLYDDPAFNKSASLKAVMPVMEPDLSYKNLNIQEGGTASASWPILTDPKLPKAKRTALHRDMIDYCRLDVYGMVRILQKLDRL